MSKDFSKLYAFLQAESVLTLATNDLQGPWSAPVLYVADVSKQPFCLYFLSSANSRHSKALVKSEPIAASIYSDYTGHWQSIKGAQLQVTVSALDNLESAKAEGAYFDRFPDIKTLIDNPVTKQEQLIGAAFSKSVFYRADPSSVRFTNNSDSFAGRTEWQFT